jgi:hypothetical protein
LAREKIFCLNGGCSKTRLVRPEVVQILSAHLRGFPKTSVFGKATVDLGEKADFRPLFPKPFPKLTGFWEWLLTQGNNRPNSIKKSVFSVWSVVKFLNLWNSTFSFFDFAVKTASIPVVSQGFESKCSGPGVWNNLN